MLKIANLEINSFRSILNLKLEIQNTPNIISICGENNVGKTNTLRAINLFFYPDEYELSLDRPTLKQAQGGTRIDPKITVTFYDDIVNKYYKITRDFKYYNTKEQRYLTGIVYTKRGKQINSKSQEKMSFADIKNKLEGIEFRYIESINIDIPDLIEKLTSNAIDVEYEQSRMSKNKAELKQAYLKYTSGLQDILDIFSKDISQVFNEFKSNWDVKFKVPNSSDTFRDLISDDVELLIDDKGCNGIEQKGSGLQRLAVILLNFEILKRIKHSKSYIVCIDEPDIFLHDGLQKKLMNFFRENSKTIQIFFTTHSKNFIDQYSMRNVILLGAKHYSQHSTRKKRSIDVVETHLIETNTNLGYKKICEQLGIVNNNYDFLSQNNLIVEGTCDKIYIEKMCNYFNISLCDIISANGVNNIEKYLSFYDSCYYNANVDYKPKIKILFDNDNNAREIYKLISRKVYNHININCVLIQNFTGNANGCLENNNTNNEIEDFIYPEVICYLTNNLLKNRGFNIIDTKQITEMIKSPAFGSSGILSVIENQKNQVNLQNGDKIKFTNGGKVTNQIKGALAKSFKPEGDRELCDIIELCDTKYPNVKKFLSNLFDFSKTW